MNELNTLIREARELSGNITLEFLNNAVRRLDATVPEGSTATFSSGTSVLNSTGGQNASNFVTDISLDSADASGAARITSMADTDVGRFLQNGDVRLAIRKAGLTDAVNAATPDSPWGIASARYAGNISGDVVAVVQNADPDRIFGAIELEEALGNSNVTSINGIDRTTLAQMSLDDAFGAVKAASTDASIGLINKGLLDGTVEKDLYSSYISSILPDDIDISARTDVFSQADIDNYSPPSSGSFGDFPLLKISALGAAMEVMRQLGPVGDALAFASTDVQARALEEAGDHEAAAKLWIEFWFETAGGAGLGGAGAYAGSHSGPWTAFGLGLLGSVAGSFGGGSLGGWLYDQNPEWFEPFVGGRLDENKITTEQFVPVVGGSSNGSHSFVNWIYNEGSDSWIGISPAANEPLHAISGSEKYAELMGFRDARIVRNSELDIKYNDTPLTNAEQSNPETVDERAQGSGAAADDAVESNPSRTLRTLPLGAPLDPGFDHLEELIEKGDGEAEPKAEVPVLKPDLAPIRTTSTGASAPQPGGNDEALHAQLQDLRAKRDTINRKIKAANLRTAQAALRRPKPRLPNANLGLAFNHLQSADNRYV